MDSRSEDFELDQWISISPSQEMEPLLGDRPNEDVFTGALTGRMIQAVINDSCASVRQGANLRPADETRSLQEIVHEACTFAALHTARRIALELNGCTIDPDHERDDA